MVIQNCLHLLREISEIESKIKEVQRARQAQGLPWKTEDDERLLRSLIEQTRGSS